MKAEQNVPFIKRPSSSRACVGIFESAQAAIDCVDCLRQAGLDPDGVSLFAPGPQRAEIEPMVSELGSSKPLSSSSSRITLWVPGVGSVFVYGAIAAELNADGMRNNDKNGALGSVLVKSSLEGILPVDDVYAYENAIVQGRTLLVAAVEERGHGKVWEILEASGAESKDAAMKGWWVGVCAARRLSYMAAEKKDLLENPLCRVGFETALMHDKLNVSPEPEPLFEDENLVMEKSDAYWLGYLMGKSQVRRTKSEA